MDTHTSKFKVRLGLFIIGGLALFVIVIFFIGKQKNLFNPVFELTTKFYNVSGLQVGNNVRFSGITVGIVDNIKIINDSTVRVDMLIKKSVQQFIKADCEAGIGSSGIIGDRVLIITQGSSDARVVKDGQEIESIEPVETDAIMASLEVTAANAAIISDNLSEIMMKINSGQGTIGRLIEDSTIAENFSQTMLNIKKSSRGLDENMNAVKKSFLFKRYFRKKAEAAQKTIDDAAGSKAIEQKASDKKQSDINDKKAKEQKASDKKQSDLNDKKAKEQKASDKKQSDLNDKNAKEQKAKDKKQSDLNDKNAKEQKEDEKKKN